MYIGELTAPMIDKGAPSSGGGRKRRRWTREERMRTPTSVSLGLDRRRAILTLPLGRGTEFHLDHL